MNFTILDQIWNSVSHLQFFLAVTIRTYMTDFYLFLRVLILES